MPIFIKTGYWEKLQKGFRGYLNLDDLIQSVSPPSTITTDELAAIQGANSPNATNSFATMNDLADISGLSIQSAVVVETTSNAKTNGVALIAAYAAAKLLTPNGSALSATNRACVIIPPGNYDLDHGEDDACVPLVLDTEFVDVVGLTSDNSLQHVYGTPPATNSGVIVQTANDVHILNLTVEILTEVEEVEGNYAYNYDDTDSAAYWPDTDLTAVIIDNCRFVGAEGATGLLLSMRLGIIYSGTFTSCTGGAGSFGGAGTASGTFTSCTGGWGSFGGYGEASGTFTSCTGGAGSFGGAGTASGTFTSCTGGIDSFGGGAGTASGTFTSCTGGDYSFGAGGTASGTFTSCTGGNYSFGNGDGTASGTFTSCTGGNYSFGSGGTASGTFTFCTGGGESFGAGGTASGTFTFCTGGGESFGAGGTASGTFTNCTGGDDSFGGAGGTASGTFTFCKGGVDSFNNRTLAEGGKIYACVDDGGFIDELVYIPLD